MTRQLTIALLALIYFQLASSEESSGLPSVAKMPDLPQPFILRDWQKVARDFDRFVFDSTKQGEHLPLYWEENSRIANDVDGFGLPSYVGDSRQNSQTNTHEAITTMSAVLGGTLVGIDKRQHAEKLRAKFHAKDGIGLYLNNHTSTGDSFWYDTFPSLLFISLYAKYPDIPQYHQQLVSTADAWREVLIELGGAQPNFEHTGFKFKEKQPVNHNWKEPDVAAGIACIEYLAYTKTKDPKYLEAAQWAFDWLSKREENPFYENLMPYGAYASARSNAEQGTNYPTGKFIEWILNGENPRKWGAALEKWRDTEVYGLIGSVYPNYEYAFTMNSFQAVGVSAPIARYEEKYAPDIAKWILNVAVNGRYFYPNAWPAEGQSSWEWSKKHDPDFCIPYEGLRKQGTTRDYPKGDKIGYGKISNGDPTRPEKRFTLIADEMGRVSYQGKLHIPSGEDHKLMAVIGHRTRWNDQPVIISLTKKDEASIAEVAFKDDGGSNLRTTHFKDYTGEATITISAKGLQPGAKVKVDDVLVETRFANPPHVGGDPTVHGWGATDLGLYGGSAAAYLGAMIEPSNVEGIILIDPIATDMMPPQSYKTRLIFNPFSEEKTVELNVGEGPNKLYDALTNRVINTGSSGKVSLPIAAKQTLMIVTTPVEDYIEKDGKLLCRDMVIDYQYHPNPAK